MVTFTKEISCDICKKHIGSEKLTKDDIRNKEVSSIPRLLFSTQFDRSISVVFTTNQTDGYPTKPYLSQEVVTICDDCLGHVFNGQQLFGEGAQGRNTYSFKTPW